MSTERYTLDDLDADELSAVMAHRARKAAPPAPKPKAAPKRRLDRAALLASLALVCVMLVLAGFRVAEYVAAYAAAFAPTQSEQPAPLPTARVVIPAAPARPVVVPASVPQPTVAAPAAAAPVAPQEVQVPAPISPQAQPDQIGVNADLAAGGNGSTAPLPEVLPTVVPAQPVSPYNPADPTAAADWEKALRNSGVDVDATQVACNADLAAGGMGCQP